MVSITFYDGWLVSICYCYFCCCCVCFNIIAVVHPNPKKPVFRFEWATVRCWKKNRNHKKKTPDTHKHTYMLVYNIISGPREWKENPIKQNYVLNLKRKMYICFNWNGTLNDMGLPLILYSRHRSRLAKEPIPD